MTPLTHAKGQTIALFGLGGSGLATARALKEGGAHVIACDDSAAQMDKAAAEGIETGDLRKADWMRFQSFVLSPGVPLSHKDGKPFTHWSVDLARQHGVEVIGDIELFCRERRAIAPRAPLIAITGTNGKSTTTALVAHILRESGLDAQIGGNIGTAILSLPPPAPRRFHVIECSSFQIDLAPTLDPMVGALLNITPDHLDRHGTMENYAAIKARLVERAECALVSVDDEWCHKIGAKIRADEQRIVAPVSVERKLEWGWFADGSQIVSKSFDKTDGEVFADVAGIGALRGRHNLQNALFACAAVWHMHVDADGMQRGLSTFPGLAHRLEQLGQVGRTLVINDSKATNADSTEKALQSFPSDIFWILGGKSKEGGIDALRPYFPRIAKAYLIGAATDEFAATLDGKVAFERCDTLDVAVARAARDASGSTKAEPVVLLSPACASYDQFPNFEVRGDAFRALVKALPGFVPAGAVS